MGTAVRVAALEKDFQGGHRALDGVDLEIDPGVFVALVGSNGAGKSTLLRCLTRLVEPTSGSIVVGGCDVSSVQGRELRRLRRRVGFVFQRLQLMDRLTVFQNVLHGALGRAGVRGWLPATATAEERDEAMVCLDRVGLAATTRRRAGTLSGGQRQRVAIARMLMQRPELVLADEPVASLDPAAAVAVMELLREVARERHMTVVAALHQLDFARAYADRVVGMRQGRIVLDAATSDWRDSELAELYSLQEASA